MSELARFRRYARRVRKLVAPGSKSPDVLPGLRRLSDKGPLLPNLKTLCLQPITADFTRNILSCLRCPDLQHIRFQRTPRDPVIIAAVSEFVLSANRSALWTIDVDSPLTEEALEAIRNLPNLHELSMVIKRDVPPPSLLLPALTHLRVVYDEEEDCLRMFRGATLEKLLSVRFTPQSEQIGDFLGAFEEVALAASVQNTLSSFRIDTRRSWNPVFSPLLSFKQMKHLAVRFPCDDGCSSRVDDDAVINLAQAMPKLEFLQLGAEPCRIAAGVTVKGPEALAHHCQNLWSLRTLSGG